MKRRKATELERLRRRITRLDAHSIDRLYGLEPVWEPATGQARVAPEEFVAVRCPYCAGDQACLRQCSGCVAGQSLRLLR